MVGASDVHFTVNPTKSAIDGPHIDQIVQHPSGNTLVFVALSLRCLSGDKGPDPVHYGPVIRAGVEVHRKGDLINDVHRDLGHLIGRRVDPLQHHLARVQVVQRRGARQGLEPAREPLVERLRRWSIVIRRHPKTLTLRVASARVVMDAGL